MNIISKEGNKRILIHHNESNIGTPELVSGKYLLNISIHESHFDTNATTSMVKHKLLNLDSYIQVVENEVENINKYVQTLVNTLAEIGHTTQYQITNIFKRYGACSDDNFVD